MGEKTYKLTQIVGTSDASFADAVAVAVDRARSTLRNLKWFEVVEERGRIDGGDVEYQVKLDVAFELEG